MDISKFYLDSKQPKIIMNDYINNTSIDCNEETIEVVRNFVNDHMQPFTCSLDASMEVISQYQIEIRQLIEPYMKRRLPYLKHIKFSKPDFYALFVLILVIDQVNEYNWEHVNSLVYFRYNEQDKDSSNQYDLIMRDDYFDLTVYNDGSTLEDVNCCCSKPHIHPRLSTKISNGKYTFILGSHCIKKMSIAYFRDKDSRVRRNDKLIKSERERLEREEQERLERQRLESEGRRWCLDCDKLFPECQPSFMVRCSRCYAKHKNEQRGNQSHCLDCHELLPKGQTSFVVR